MGDLTASEAQKLLEDVITRIAARLSKKTRNELAAALEADLKNLQNWMRGRAAIPSEYPASLNFLGRHSQELAQIHDPQDLGHLVVYGQCGCLVRVSALCRVGIDHRANAQYEVETNGKNKTDPADTLPTPGPADIHQEPRPTALAADAPRGEA